MINRESCAEGINLLKTPVLPLVSIVQFLFVTGEFATIEEVIAEFPDEIETGYTVYRHARSDLAEYADLMHDLMVLKNGRAVQELVVDHEGTLQDTMVTVSALVRQKVLSKELERINSALCAPCGCTLCCVGPDAAMVHDFFEIPLQDSELNQFQIKQVNSPESQSKRASDKRALQVDGKAFFERPDPVLISWQNGWSLILPRKSCCPHLERSGRCRVYMDRPAVCRKPQIFPYVVEPVPAEGQTTFRIRQSLLGVVDCPYVQLLQKEITAYAAACELEMVFRRNKA